MHFDELEKKETADVDNNRSETELLKSENAVLREKLSQKEAVESMVIEETSK